MRDFFLVWITVQLVILGIVGVDTLNQLTGGTYDCQHHIEEYDKPIPTWVGGVFPLAFFMNVTFDKQINEYCQENYEPSENLLPLP